MKPILSVIVPIYNVENYIERCARSLLEQTLNRYEIIEYIFINDYSPDSSEIRLRKVIENYPLLKDNIKIIMHTENKGLFLARRTGLMNAKGKYIIHIDSDDWVENNMMEEMVHLLEHEKSDMCYCGMVHDCADGIGRVSYFPKLREAKEFLKEMICYPNLFSVWNKMYRKDIALKGEEFLGNEIVTSGEDLRRNSAILLKCNKISYVDKILYHYCDNPKSITKLERDNVPDLIANGNFLSKKMPERFKESILSYKRMVILGTISGRYSSFFAMNHKNIWPEAYIGITYDKRINQKHRYFILLSKYSYVLARTIWKFSFSLYSYIKLLIAKKTDI